MREERLLGLLVCITFIIAFIVTLLPTLPYSIVKADDPSPKFEKPSIDPEIGAVNSIIQDHYGYLWFGTGYDLVRYDGIEVIHYQYSCSDPNSIPGLCAVVICETAGGSIWVGTEGGLGKLNRSDGTFQRYTYDPDNPESLSCNIISALAEDKEGILWIGTTNGLNSFDKYTGVFTHYCNNPDDPTSISSNNISSIFEDSEGILWIGTKHGLNQFNKESGTFSRYYCLDSDLNSISVKAIYETEDGLLWLCTVNGLYNFDKESGSLIPSFLLEDYSSYNIERINSIFEDSDNTMWIGTNNGLMSYDREENDLNHYGDDVEGILFNNIYAICESMEGVLWFGTSSGLYKLDQKKSIFDNYNSTEDSASFFSGESVKSFCGSSNNDIWIGTPSTIYKFSQETREFIPYSYLPSDIGDINVNSVVLIYEDSGGCIWIAMPEGIYCFYPEIGKVQKYYEFDGENIDIMNKIFEDSNGNLILGEENGLFKYDNNTKQFINYFTNYELIKALGRDLVWEIYEDSSGYLWIGTDSGVYVVDMSDETFSYYSYDPSDENSLIGTRIKTITEDRNGNIWIGTSNGLSKFDTDTSQFTNYSVENGLSSNIICGLLEDDNGNLWISTNNGLTILDTVTGVFTNYDASHGLDTIIFNYGACYKAQDGELFFGGIDGMVSFYPDELLVQNESVPLVLIKNFTTFNIHKSDTYDQPVEDIGEVVLPYSANSFEIGFVAIDYTSPENNHYAYILVGFDEGWHYTDGMRNSATYTNIPSGEYTFLVKAANSYDVWNEEGSSFQITITPPFWQEWWFILLMISAAILLIFAIIRLRTHTLHVRSQKLEAMVAERTGQLEEQIKQRVEFTRALVHELKTPITAMMSSSELLMRQPRGELGPRLARNIYMGTNSLNNRIDELLDLARGEIGKLDITPKSLDSLELVQQVVDEMTAEAGKKEQSLVLESANSLPPAWADGDRLQQILLNLIINAIKFSPNKSTIKVIVREENGFILFDVQDEGDSISLDEQQRLFQPYYRKESDREHLSGLGIGLALAKTLVELHGGKIWVRSRKGYGNTFGFSIPLEGKAKQ